MFYVKFILGLLFSIAFVAGPYIALLIVWPTLPFWIHFTYWFAMVIYLMGAATTNPTYDDTNLGWAGGLIDNPFSFEDDMNRMGLGLMLFLLPGKAVCWTIAAGWTIATGKAGRGQHS